MGFYLGIDGGGTRTTAWLGDERRVLARAEAGPSNPLKVGYESSQREILRAARRAVAAVYDRRIPAAPAEVIVPVRRPRSASTARRYRRLSLDAVVVGLAGVDRPPVHDRLLRWLKKSIPARAHLLTSDAAIAVAAGLGGAPGIVVIAGTGSIGFGRDERGRLLRSGGWGMLFDDAGSGYDIGLKAIAAALRSLDGRGQPTRLGPAICRALRLKELPEVVWRPLPPQQVAALFPVVQRVARQGDFVARHLLDMAGRDLAELATALIERLQWKRKDVTVLGVGGVFRSSTRVRDVFVLSVRSTAPRARVRMLTRPPVEGALTLARQLISQK